MLANFVDTPSRIKKISCLASSYRACHLGLVVEQGIKAPGVNLRGLAVNTNLKGLRSLARRMDGDK